MRPLTEIVEEALRTECALRGEAVIVVAVSGGLDSMVLLDVLHRLRGRHPGRLVVAHFNHQLRGDASDADERFVRAEAEQRGLPCVSERTPVAPFARRTGQSVEMAARGLRHAFLARVARQFKGRAVALAHHADDQVELFFLRLLRGAGGEGLAGMKFRNPSPADRRVTLLRPLLSVPKAALRAHAAGQGIRFREDLTNAALVLKRNRIRHELLPLLARHYQPAIGAVVHRAIQVLGDETEYVRQAAAGWLQASKRGRFGRLPRAVQRQVIQLQLIALGVMPNFDLVEQLRGSAGRTIPGVGDALLRRRADGVIEHVAPVETAFRDEALLVELAKRIGPVVFGKVEVRWSLRRCEVGAPRPRFGAGFEYFDAGKVGSAITLRHWRAGDRFQPIGLTSEVKLQDLFTNAGIPRADRHGLVVAATARGEVFWVEGLRIGERFKLDKSTRSRLKWRWRRGAGRVAVPRRA